MRDPFAGYDAWLERPYQDMMDASEEFYEWAYENDYDVDDPEDMKAAEEDYQDYLAGMEEDRYLAAYEDAMDRKFDEMRERDWDMY